jgi:hypothetical protein
MQHISKLFSNKNFNNKPWLLVGKGPSFDKISDIKLDDFYVMALNHTISTIQKADIAHFIDFDVFEKCQDDIYQKAKYVCMPINPNFNNVITHVTIADLMKKNSILAKLSAEKRLFWYARASKKNYLGLKNFKKLFYKDVPAKYFSAEAPFHILGMNGVKEIYSAGIDGGNNYSQKFSNTTLLANGRYSFDSQFKEIIKAIKKYDLIYSPLNASYPVKVYVGSQEEQMLSVKVLEYSIKKRTKVNVEVFPLHKSNIEYGIPKDPENRQRTPFSFQRFLIPELNKFEGKAIYVDSDMQVMKDIRQLWNLPMDSHDLFTVESRKKSNRVLQFSVMLLSCDKLKWSVNDIINMLDSGELNYHSLMKEMKMAKNIGVKIPFGWNSLEWYSKKDGGLIHYTDMPTQPWVSVKNPLCKIWMKDLINAIDEGFIPIDYVKDHIQRSWVRPSLLYQIENNILDSRKLSKKVLAMDKDFVAPYKKIELAKKKK